MKLLKLNFIYILSFLFSSLFLLHQCEDEDDTRRQFIWFGTVNGKEGNYIVHCDNECVSCTAFVAGGDYVVLPKTSTAYKRCLQLPKSKDINDTSNITNLLVEFLEDTAFEGAYGFDSWIKENGSAFPEKESYISLKAGGYTRFQVRITTGNDAFNSFTLTVEDNTLNLSFDSLNDDVKTLILYPGVTPVTVYSHNNYSEGEAEFSITANSRNGEICLAGRECETGEDGLVCVVYRDIVYYNYQLYCVNNPSFNPDTNEWKEKFNSVIKQAVLNIESVEKRTYNNSDWDDNGNGILDLFVSKIDVPSERLEHERLLASIESTYTDVPTCYTGCPPNEQEPKTMILPGTIRRNWLILEDANKGDSLLILNSVVDLKDSMEIFIRAWGGPPEYNVIKYTDPNNSIILRHPLSNSYPAYSSVVTDCMGFIRGFTIESCTWVEDLESYRNVIHEFCHFKAVGPLSHAVKDNSNVMFPLYGDYGTKLRYRYLETDDLFDLGALENQWKQLHTLYPY